MHRIAPPPSPASSPRLLHLWSPPDAMTFHLPGGIICLDSDASIGSDVEEIVKWDDCLRKTKTFLTAYSILVGRKYSSPLLDKHQTLLLVTISNGGKKVNMPLAEARKQLKKGSKKSPPELMPISSEHTPPYSNFVSNVDNRAWRNGLSSEPMYMHQEVRNTTAAAALTAPAALTATMTERVQKRVLDVFLDVSLNVSSPATKKIAAKVHAQLARKDPAFTSVVDRFQDVKCSQEISSACLELQRAME